jgi:hypothetical protein
MIRHESLSAASGTAPPKRRICRLFLSGGYHISASVDRTEEGAQILAGFGLFGVWVIAGIVGWHRWPHASFGSPTCRVGLGEWQTDAPGSVHGFGPFWFTRPPVVEVALAMPAQEDRHE